LIVSARLRTEVATLTSVIFGPRGVLTRNTSPQTPAARRSLYLARGGAVGVREHHTFQWQGRNEQTHAMRGTRATRRGEIHFTSGEVAPYFSARRISELHAMIHRWGEDGDPLPAGEVDLTAACRPGATHRVSLLVRPAIERCDLSYTDSPPRAR